MTPSCSTNQKVFVVKKFYSCDGYFFSLEKNIVDSSLAMLDHLAAYQMETRSV